MLALVRHVRAGGHRSRPGRPCGVSSPPGLSGSGAGTRWLPLISCGTWQARGLRHERPSPDRFVGGSAAMDMDREATAIDAGTEVRPCGRAVGHHR